jgi:hypothetical protein
MEIREREWRKKRKKKVDLDKFEENSETVVDIIPNSRHVSSGLTICIIRPEKAAGEMWKYCFSPSRTPIKDQVFTAMPRPYIVDSVKNLEL